MDGRSKTHKTQGSPRTREAITQALNRFVLSEPYEDLGVKQLVAEARVSRSTFYEHFANKDAVLRDSVAPVLGPLADVVVHESSAGRIVGLLDHLAENRVRAQAVLAGPAGQQIVRTLASLIEERLRARADDEGTLASGIPVELASAQLAEAQLSLIRAWLQVPSRCERADLARAIEATSHALVAALGDRAGGFSSS